jgi:hypothetical protein
MNGIVVQGAKIRYLWFSKWRLWWSDMSFPLFTVGLYHTPPGVVWTTIFRKGARRSAVVAQPLGTGATCKFLSSVLDMEMRPLKRNIYVTVLTESLALPCHVKVVLLHSAHRSHFLRPSLQNFDVDTIEIARELKKLHNLVWSDALRRRKQSFAAHDPYRYSQF